jgi:hypothetical protein
LPGAAYHAPGGQALPASAGRAGLSPSSADRRFTGTSILILNANTWPEGWFSLV